MRRTLTGLALSCALLLLLISPSIVLAQDAFVRLTMSSPWGFGETLVITQTPSGATILWQWQRPAAAGMRAGSPPVLSHEGETEVSPDRFTGIARQLTELDIASLGSFVQPNIEDAGTHHFEGKLGETTFDFTVYGVPADFEDQSYFRILSILYDSAKDIEMKEVQR